MHRASPARCSTAARSARVILIITEDAWTFDVLPRLEVAGADISMIQVICTDKDGSGSPLFPRDLHLIGNAKPAPALVVVDAWLDTVPTTYRVRDPQDARAALHPWKEVASATGAAVLLLCHTNRLATGDTRNKYGTTYALRQKVRTALYAIQDDGGNLVLGPDKANGVVTETASVLTIKSIQKFDPTDDHDGTVPLLTYVRESDRTIKEHVLGAHEAEHGDDPQDRVDAETWLRDYLQIEGPQAQSADAKREAKKAGIAERTLQRARGKLQVVIGYEGRPAKSVWSLPEQVSTDA